MYHPRRLPELPTWLALMVSDPCHRQQSQLLSLDGEDYVSGPGSNQETMPVELALITKKGAEKRTKEINYIQHTDLRLVSFKLLSICEVYRDIGGREEKEQGRERYCADPGSLT